MRTYTLFFYLLLPFVFVSCNGQENPKYVEKKNEMKSISIHRYGGELGYSKFIKITNDTVYFEFNLASDKAHNRVDKKLNSKFKLESIINKNELTQLNNIKNGKSRLYKDGTDTQLVIETLNKVYTINNAEYNKLWIRISNKLDEICAVEFNE